MPKTKKELDEEIRIIADAIVKSQDTADSLAEYLRNLRRRAREMKAESRRRVHEV